MSRTIKVTVILLEILSLLAGLTVLISYPLYCPWALVPYTFILLNLIVKLIGMRINQRIQKNKKIQELLKD